MRIGAKVPNSGPLPAERGIGAMAKELEDSGFESLWVSDHIVMPTVINARYPFAADGKATWPSDTPYFDAMISLALIAAATTKAVIGTAVLVLPLRNPIVLAKQAASIDVVSGGRLALGVGSGWLAEEFDALDVPFETRGRRFVEWMELLRSCWTGAPPAFTGEHYQLPDGNMCVPTPAHEIELLVGGHSKIARKRAVTIGNGWLAHQSAKEIDSEDLAKGVAEMSEVLATSGKDQSTLWTTLRLIDSVQHLDEVVEALPGLRDAGIDEIIVDTDWGHADVGPEVHGRLREALSR
jgi:probable F420-dependent oxidoreductase